MMYPISCVEALPGDTMEQQSNVLLRVSPLAAPVMHPVTARVHHFFCPNRILWDGWEDFITGGPDGLNADNPPQIMTTGIKGDLLDYLGLPPVAGISVNALPLMAINLIFNQWYRDQDLVAERDLLDTTIPNIAWAKDYFTSARPWTQKGPDITVPLGQRAPVTGLGKQDQETGGLDVYQAAALIDGSSPGGSKSLYVEEDPANPGYPGIFADLSQAIGGNVNDVRKAFAMQRYEEARARYGSRYTEYLRYLGVNPKDARLQRSEMLGGGQAQINFSEVLQTAPEPDPATRDFGVSDMYGHGIAALRSNKYRRFIEEHGFIISVLSVRPKAIYTNGIHRSFLRMDKEDYFQKELQFIGQQEVMNNEVYADPANGTDTFGYQDRYSEYREQPSRVSNEFRDVLNYWHLGREFTAPPVLNQSFTDCNPSKRIFNEQTMNGLWVMVQNKIMARRLVNAYSNPRIL